MSDEPRSMKERRGFSWTPLPLLCVIAVWEWRTSGDPAASFLCGRPHEIALSMLELLGVSGTWWNLVYTSTAIALGLGLGSLMGAIVGVVLASFPVIMKLSRGYLIVLGAVPVFALAPMIILWLGIGWWTKVVLAAYASGLVTLQLAVTGAEDAYHRYRDVIELGDGSKLRVLRHVVIPGALLWLTEGYRAGVGAAVLGAFIGECLNSDAGIGHMMMRASGLYRVNEVWCGVILLGMVALALGGALELLIRLCAPGHARLIRAGATPTLD